MCEIQQINSVDILQSILLLASVIVAYFAISQGSKNLSKQLEIEQTPYIVGKGAIFTNRSPSNVQATYLQNCLYLKNIGRGMARNINVSVTDSWVVSERLPFFEGNQSNTIDLGGNQDAEPWLVHLPHLEKAEVSNNDLYIYIYFSDQLDNEYKTILHLNKDSNIGYRVMGNKLERRIR